VFKVSKDVICQLWSNQLEELKRPKGHAGLCDAQVSLILFDELCAELEDDFKVLFDECAICYGPVQRLQELLVVLWVIHGALSDIKFVCHQLLPLLQEDRNRGQGFLYKLLLRILNCLFVLFSESTILVLVILGVLCLLLIHRGRVDHKSPFECAIQGLYVILRYRILRFHQEGE
jgi:hypothetical protein